MIEQRVIGDREQWKQWRREVVTASQVGAMFGLDPYPKNTPLRLFASMRGVEFNDDDPHNKVMRRGNWLEDSFPRILRDVGKPEWTLRAPGLFYVDVERGIGATPDFLIDGDARGVGVLQAKTVAPHVFRRDWNDGQEVPAWILLQVLTEMILVDAAFGVVAGLRVDAFDMDCCVIEVARHPAAEAKILSAVRKFVDNVRDGIEPDVDLERDGATLKLLLPRERPGSEIYLGADHGVPVILAARAEAIAEMKRLKKRCETIETRLRLIMGEFERAVGLDGWSISCKVQKRKAYSVPESESRVLRIIDRRPPEERPDAETDDE
jgi:YqaJ-like viral recombinase domain